MALWSPSSLIALRMLTRDERRIDGAFLHGRLEEARARRESCPPDATAFRLVHGEADDLPSLIVDRYGDHLVLQCLSAGMEALRSELIAVLLDVFRPASVLARNDVFVRRFEDLPEEVAPLHGEVPDRLEVREGTIRYLVDLRTGQKTGAFLDQRENRRRAGELARGHALDCFSYHGSFALHMARRAERVTAVDASGPALARALENAALNDVRIDTIEANVFEWLRAQERAGQKYDTIVLDPPAFAKSKRSLGAALRGYNEINLRAMRLLAPDGHLLTFSCSHHVDEAAFRQMLTAAAHDAGRPVEWVEARGQASDHPVLLQIPETSYLKGAVLRAR